MLILLWLIITVLRPELLTTRSHPRGETPVPSSCRAISVTNWTRRASARRYPHHLPEGALSEARSRTIPSAARFLRNAVGPVSAFGRAAGAKGTPGQRVDRPPTASPCHEARGSCPTRGRSSPPAPREVPGPSLARRGASPSKRLDRWSATDDVTLRGRMTPGAPPPAPSIGRPPRPSDRSPSGAFLLNYLG
jgi:hypothetical protein